MKQVSGWKRIVARIRGEVPAAALEAYRGASLPVFELLDQVERRRLAHRIDGMDPWATPAATRAEFLCAWNAFVLQTLGNDLLDADYREEPVTSGYVPPATADQILRFYDDAQRWVLRAYQAQANPDYRLDVTVPAPLPAWTPVDHRLNAHLAGLLHAMDSVGGHAAAAMAALPGAGLGDARRQAQLNAIQQVYALGQTRARYADDLRGQEHLPEIHRKAQEHARAAIEHFYLLGQLIADPSLVHGPSAPGLRPLQLAPAVPAHAGTTGTQAVRQLLPERERSLLNTALDGNESLLRRKAAVSQACGGPTPVADLVWLYDQLAEAELKGRVLLGLSSRAEAEAVEKLADVARHDPDEWLRHSARFWLRWSRHERAPALLATLPGT